ncbi:hypothetical protein [Pseudoruegeria sp. SK021]|uniref:hypothetical protein n=1 Tax=Pseudoruegeria sp. SK021 TaxID=1933035 RepID=UPI000A260A92|nr:hypothetical protein [Pseudoruegeria sp. SK021]OSP56565.1 hypothetical protein BV911_00965 [Pseudoruegeria sp. SK021]
MTQEILLSPLINPMLLAALAGGMALVTGFALWRRLSGWWLRGFGAVVLLLALANPSLQTENRAPLSDIVIAVVDDSASQRIGGRPDQSAAALARIEAEVAGLPNTELRVVRVGDAPGNEGTLLMSALAEALANEPRNRVAGMILITDGQIHDLEQAPDLPAPLHTLLTGEKTDWDRRLTVTNAPAFAIMGEPVTLTLRLEDQGRVPAAEDGTAVLQISVDGGAVSEVVVPVGRDLELPVTLPHGGMNVVQFTVPVADGELTERNNAAVVQINGVRDRLRVLLVSGEPHAGERTWRNLLKSDSSVDLVHFTILRPPEKQDGVPVTELSLIAFPTRELFLEKIDEFDLIIFDRYKRRGILPEIYLDNIRMYVERGGAVLVAAGPDFASASSLYRSPLAQILPAEPTSRVLEEGYLPAITGIGRRHPVTEGLDGAAEAPEDGAPPPWGRWFRQVDLLPKSGEVVMSGIEDRPLLVLDRVGEGRVALLASDHAWLWNRGFEGGGPQLELLRRLAHWMMKEPELEEEALWVESDGSNMTIIRRTLGDAVADFEITAPDGTITQHAPVQVSPGRYELTLAGQEIGLYRITDGDLSAVAALGPSAPREFEQTIASGTLLDPLVSSMRGGIRAIEDGPLDLRSVDAGRPAAGRGWIGITPRGAYQTADVTVRPVLPAWLYLVIAALLIVGAWLWEGRRRAPVRP